MKKLHKLILLLFIVGLMFAPIAVLHQTVHASLACVSGARKGLIWSNNEWHHYVEFDVPNNMRWTVSGPLFPSIWGYASSGHVRAGYSWDDNWWDPYSPSAWTLCAY